MAAALTGLPTTVLVRFRMFRSHLGDALKLGDVGSGELWDPNLADGEILAVRRPSPSSLEIDVLITVNGNVWRLLFAGVDRYRVHFARDQLTDCAFFTNGSRPERAQLEAVLSGNSLRAGGVAFSGEVDRLIQEIEEGRLALFCLSGTECDIVVVCKAVTAEALPMEHGDAFPRPPGLR